MRLVADSSVIAAICLADQGLGRLEGHDLNGPAHLVAEVTSAIREQHYRNDVSDDVAARAIARLGRFEITFSPPGTFAAEAFRLAVANGWAKTYDAEYIALARHLDCPILTLDARLQRGAAHLATILAPTDL